MKKIETLGDYNSIDIFDKQVQKIAFLQQFIEEYTPLILIDTTIFYNFQDLHLLSLLNSLLIPKEKALKIIKRQLEHEKKYLSNIMNYVINE